MGILPRVKRPIYRPFEVELSDAKKQEIEEWLGERLDHVVQQNSERNAKFKELRESYDLKPYDRELPFEKAANIRIPVARILCDQIMLRLVQSHFGVTPYVRWKPKGNTPVEYARSLEELLWHVHVTGDKLTPSYLAIKDAVITGSGVVKTVWDQEWRLVREGKKKKYILKYNLPRTVHIPIEDFVIYPADAPSVDSAVFVGNAIDTLSWDDLQHGVAAGIYKKEWVDELKNRAGASIETNKYRYARETFNITNDVVDTAEDAYDLYELIVAYDLDNDGLAEDYLVTFERSLRKIIRFIEYPAAYGERWYHIYRPLPLSGTWMGESIYNQVLTIDEEVTTLHNQTLDNAQMVNMPQYTGVDGSPFWGDGQKAYPGRVWRVNDHNDIRPLVQVPSIGMGLIPIEDRLMQYGRLITGVTELNSGITPRGEKTAYEIEAALAEGSIRIRLEVAIGTVWLTRMAWHEVGLLKQFLPDGAFEEITGSFNFLNEMSWEDLWSSFKVEPIGNTTTSNRELERQKILMVREALKNDPLLFAPDPATGQVIPKPGWYELNKRFLMAHDIDDYQVIIGEPPETEVSPPIEEPQMPAVPGGELPTLNNVPAEAVPTDEYEQIKQLFNIRETIGNE